MGVRLPGTGGVDLRSAGWSEGIGWKDGPFSGISCFPACGILGQQAGIWGLDSRILVGHFDATDGGVGLAVFPLVSLAGMAAFARRFGLW